MALKRGQGGILIVIGVVLALIGVLLLIEGLQPALQIPSHPANINEVGVGAILIAIGVALAILGGAE